MGYLALAGLLISGLFIGVFLIGYNVGEIHVYEDIKKVWADEYRSKL